jgi:hypothetical protein
MLNPEITVDLNTPELDRMLEDAQTKLDTPTDYDAEDPQHVIDSLDSLAPAETEQTETTQLTKSWQDRVHPAANEFEMMPDGELNLLAADIKANGLQQPIVILAEPRQPRVILDGRNRLAALERLGALEIDKDGWPSLKAGSGIRGVDRPQSLDGLTREIVSHPTDAHIDGADEDGDGFLTEAGERAATEAWARDYVLSANVHRRHLTREQKRELIAKVLAADPSKSDRQIAEQTKTSPTTVGKVRAEAEATGGVFKLDTRTDSLGREQPATKPGKPANDDAKPDDDDDDADGELDDVAVGALEDAENPEEKEGMFGAYEPEAKTETTSAASGSKAKSKPSKPKAAKPKPLAAMVDEIERHYSLRDLIEEVHARAKAKGMTKKAA